MSGLPENATIVYREMLSPELAIIRIAPDDPLGLVFEPGQYAELALPGEVGMQGSKTLRRQYSIASSMQFPQTLELYVVLVPEGFFTPKLWQLEEGARIWVNPKPKGKFTLEPVPLDSHLVMVATGTGLAPFVSMLRSYQDSPRWKTFTIVHGVRNAIDLGYRTILETLDKENPTFFYIPTLTRELWDGHRGRVLSVFQDGTYESRVGVPFSPDHCQVFLCGNPEMIDEAEVTLGTQGFRIHKKKEPGNLHIERYW